MTLQQSYSDTPEWKLQKARYRTKKRKSNIDLSQYRTEDGIVLFVRDVLNVTPAPYQERILRALVKYKRVAVRGPHGLGKTAVASWVTLWAICCFEGDVKVPTTASAWRQLTKMLWPEIRKWARKGSLDKVGAILRRGKELLELSIKFNNKEAFALAASDPAAIEGVHGDTILYVFDEAKAIPNDIWDAAEGAFATAGSDTISDAYALAISTPGVASGRFYDIHKRKPGYDDWHPIHVTLQEAISAGRISQEWADTRKRQWGENSAVYTMRVLGEFDTSGEHTIMPLEWIEAAIERWHTCNGKGSGEQGIGVDPARFGTDKTAIANCVGNVIESIEYSTKEDTMQTTGRVVNYVAGSKEINIAVDVIGVGAGVVDRLKELGFTVFGVNVGHKSYASDVSGEIGFLNLRAELWWMMRELLDPANNNDIALPPDDLMTGDLTAPLYKYTSKGLIQVESKDEIRARIGRSTDGADAVMLALYVARIPKMADIEWLD